MTARDVNRKELARLAFWARIACAPIRYRGRWTGFDPGEWARLSELAAAVDRKTMLRFLGISLLLMFCSEIVGALLVIALFLFVPQLFSSVHTVYVVLAIGIVAIAVVTVTFRIAVDAAARRSLIEVLTVRDGDAELAAKVRHQNFWIIGGTFAAMVLVVCTLWAFRTTTQPFFDQWGWLLYPLVIVVGGADFVIRLLRRSRPPQARFDA